MDVVRRASGSECVQGGVSVVVRKKKSNLSQILADSLSQPEQDQAGALGAADHLGNTDFLFLEQVGGTFPNVGDAEPDAVLAEVRDAEEGSENSALCSLGGETNKEPGTGWRLLKGCWR